jgi:hypothetical protein
MIPSASSNQYTADAAKALQNSDVDSWCFWCDVYNTDRFDANYKDVNGINVDTGLWNALKP